MAYSPSVHRATEHTAPRRPALPAGLWVPEARRGPAGRGRPLWGSRTRGQTGDSPCPGHRRAVGKRSQNVTGDRCARKTAAEPKQGTDGLMTGVMPPQGDASPLPAAGTSAPTRTRRGRAACGALPQGSHAELRFLPESPSSLSVCPLPSPPPAAGRPQQPLAVPCPLRGWERGHWYGAPRTHPRRASAAGPALMLRLLLPGVAAERLFLGWSSPSL